MLRLISVLIDQDKDVMNVGNGMTLMCLLIIINNAVTAAEQDMRNR